MTHNIKKSAPIAFFAYKRPKHTRLALESLARNIGAESSELFIFCDGPKSITDNEAIEEVRQIARSRQWCGTVNVIESEYNKGLANSIIAGVTKLCEKFGRVIVLEDDLILSPYFLDYMNSALDFYGEESRVMYANCNMIRLKVQQAGETLFLPFTTSWGWGTWQRAWNIFDPDVSQYKDFATDSQQINEFNLEGNYPFFSMLKAQLDGRLDSWAIRWYFSVFTKSGLVLYPKWSLVQNIGFDGSGTHCQNREVSVDRLCNKLLNVRSSGNVRICKKTLSRIGEYLSSGTQSGDSSLKNILLKIKNYF